MRDRDEGAPSYPPIGDYALIGDCRGTVLVSRDGSLDWLCFPRFDSPPIFCALLDAQGGGRFRIRPSGPFRSERRYIPDTNVLRKPSGTRSCQTMKSCASMFGTILGAFYRSKGG
jgi:GH15 family glucan-1,4-alpha-glucosidase